MKKTLKNCDKELVKSKDNGIRSNKKTKNYPIRSNKRQNKLLGRLKTYNKSIVKGVG
jgi:hypothetical protein